MNIKKMIGQLFVIGFEGTILTPELQQLIHEYHIGAVILFNRNIASVEQLKELTASIQSEAKLANYERPILISLDQENGVVRRINRELTLFPGAMSLAATGKIQNAFDVSQASARELLACGINWNLAPVADVNNNPENPIIGVRSFGDDPHEVAKYVVSSMKGMQAEGLITCLKHFPGHGDTNVDSHLAVPTIHKSFEELTDLELIPFKEAIEAGSDTIMISHIVFPTFEEKPASISPVMITDILRETLGFKGVVTTDCMEMDAIDKTIGVKKGCYQAFKAGCDYLMISHSLDKQLETFAYFEEMITRGELSIARIQESLGRINQLKDNYLAEASVECSMNEMIEHQQLADKVYQEAIILDDDYLVDKIQDQKILVLFPNQKTMLRVEDIQNAYDFEKLFGKLSSKVEVVLYDEAGMCENSVSLSELVSMFDLLILCTVNLSKDAWICKEILSITKPIIHITLRNPYDVSYIQNKNILKRIITLEPTSFVLEKVIDSLKTASNFSGELPVNLV